MTDLNLYSKLPYGIVYIVKNTKNGKMYVGQTRRNIKARWNQHCSNSSNSCRALSSAISKYGRDAFVVEVFAQAFSKVEMDNIEFEAVNKLNTISPFGYNLKFGGGSRSKFSDESRRKMSEIHRSDSVRAKHVQSTSERWKNEKYREYTVSKIIEAWSRPGVREKMSLLMKETHGRLESRQKSSATTKKLWLDKTFRANVLNKIQSTESRLKKSTAAKMFWSSDETRTRHANFMRELWTRDDYRSFVSKAIKEAWTDERKEAEKIASWERIKSPHLPPRSDNKNGYRGVRQRDGRWIARVGIGNNKQKHLGMFDTAEQARDAYIAEKNRIIEEKHLQSIKRCGIVPSN